MALSMDQALELWRGVMTAALARAWPDLTARQFALLLQVYLMPAPHRVRGLAQELGLSKPVVTRAVDRLSALGLVRRQREKEDRRSILVVRTIKGTEFLRDFGELAAALAREAETRRSAGTLRSRAR